MSNHVSLTRKTMRIMLKAYNDFCEPHFRQAAEKGWQGLISRLVEETEEGVKLNAICHGAGLSPDRDGLYSYDVSEQIVSDSFMGVTPLLLAALEMERLP
ncbi:glycoside hydrolase family 88 protein [Paenibacillus xylanivorans]|uniref:glycoside hydrolase family 88 protein n=1 Tax=Paenibacillus xylanivorans TaxID=1705561 RepID=UPI001F1D9383|nr:glycoside hydrolase family 88 protein [Paenibacillus xylanivorans]